MTSYKKIRMNDIVVDEHVWLMEQYLGRPMEPDECVHHVDFIKHNNDIENLELMLRIEHLKLHQQLGHYFDVAIWTKENMSTGYIHGTYSCWRKQRCRCEPCVMAQRIYKRDYRKRTGIH